MKKTTAVWFLFTQLDLMSFTSCEDWVIKRKEILSKAKELEREQMADAFYAPANQSEPKNFDEYYKQKYKEQKLLFNHGLVERCKQQALVMEKNQSEDCFVEKVILKDGYRSCCGKEMTDYVAEKYCKDVWLKT